MRRAATKTERNPIAEDLPTLLPQPIRRFRHVLTLAVVVLAGIAIYIVARDLIRGYWRSHMRQYLAFYARHCAA